MNLEPPALTLCYTQTLDGRVATATGESQWIGAGESVAYWHQLRTEYDAVMVGIGTVLKDNPRLTARHVSGRDPVRVVVDSALRTPLHSAVLANGAARGTVFAVTNRATVERISAARDTGATVLVLPADSSGHVDLLVLLPALASLDINSIMVEGGAALITSLLRLRLATRAVVCVAPRIMGAGIEAVGDLGVRRLAETIQLEQVQVQHFGVDIVIEGQIVYPN